MIVKRIGDLDAKRTKWQTVKAIWHILKWTVFHDTHEYKKAIKSHKQSELKRIIKEIEKDRGFPMNKEEIKAIKKNKSFVFDPKEVLPPNIYNKNQTLKQYWKEQNVYHRYFKLKVVQPFLYIGRMVLRKHIVKTVPNTKPCEMLQVYDKAFESALVTWCNVYRPTMGRLDRPKSLKVLIAKLLDSKATQTLRVFKQFYNTGVSNDTSYLMFHNILMFEIWKGMHDKYKNESHMMHILYNSNKIDDLKYFVTQGQFPDWIEVPLTGDPKNDVPSGLNLKINLKEVLQSVMNQAITIKEMDVIQRPGDKVPTKKEVQEEQKEVVDPTPETKN